MCAYGVRVVGKDLFAPQPRVLAELLAEALNGRLQQAEVASVPDVYAVEEQCCRSAHDLGLPAEASVFVARLSFSCMSLHSQERSARESSW